VPRKPTTQRKLEPRKAPSQERSRAKVEQILQATHQLLESQGLEKLTTNAIAKQAGMSVGSLYQYFPNKQAVIFELYQRWLNSVREELLEYDHDSLPTVKTREDVALLARELLQEYGPAGSGKADLELDKAMKLYPELQEMDRQHGLKLASIVADIYRRAGLDLGDEELLQLGYFSYQLYGTYWETALAGHNNPELLLKWTIDALVGVIGPYLPSGDGG